MTPSKHSSGLSFAWRFFLIFCTMQTLWSHAKTTTQTDSQSKTVIKTTSAVPPLDTRSTAKVALKTNGVVGPEFLPAITEVDAKANEEKLLDIKTNEKVTATGRPSTHGQWYTERTEMNIQSTSQSATDVKKVRFQNEYDSSKRPHTEDPSDSQKGEIDSKGGQCLPTPGGIDDINRQPHCNESDLNTVVSRELTSLSTPSYDITTENTPIIGSDITTISKKIEYLSRLHDLCPLTNICEKMNQTKSCCRACSCGPDCGDNCCFRNRTEAKYSGSVPECLHVQRELPGKQVSNYRTYSIIRTCRFPKISLIRPNFPPRQQDDSWKNKLSPVFSNRTNITYYNTEYAKCNDEFDADIVYWNRIEFCASVSGQTYEDIHDSIRNGKCDTIYEPPSEYIDQVEECYEIDVDACNVVGEWDYYDEQIEQGCKNLRVPYIDEPSFNQHMKPTVFANVFCYLCNNKRGIFVRTLCPSFDISRINSLTTVLSYTDEDVLKTFSPEFNSPERNDSECGVYQILDIKEVCYMYM